MLLTSPSFDSGKEIPAKFTCAGGNINPELHIQNTPEKALSLALIVDDPDAPGGSFTHWIVWNINPATEIIKQESIPPGSSEGMNDLGTKGYTGPCPPIGKPHRYFFKLYALDIKTLPKFENPPSKDKFQEAIQEHIVEKTELVGLFRR